MTWELEQGVTEQANVDAIEHQKEFPGQPVTESWAFNAFTGMGLSTLEARDAWPVYLDALHSAVNAMIGE